MDQLVKYLPHKHEELSSGHRDLYKSWIEQYITKLDNKPSTPLIRGGRGRKISVGLKPAMST